VSFDLPQEFGHAFSSYAKVVQNAHVTFHKFTFVNTLAQHIPSPVSRPENGSQFDFGGSP